MTRLRGSGQFLNRKKNLPGAAWNLQGTPAYREKGQEDPRNSASFWTARCAGFWLDEK